MEILLATRDGKLVPQVAGRLQAVSTKAVPVTYRITRLFLQGDRHRAFWNSAGLAAPRVTVPALPAVDGFTREHAPRTKALRGGLFFGLTVRVTARLAARPRARYAPGDVGWAMCRIRGAA